MNVVSSKRMIYVVQLHLATLIDTTSSDGLYGNNEIDEIERKHFREQLSVRLRIVLERVSLAQKLKANIWIG